MNARFVLPLSLLCSFAAATGLPPAALAGGDAPGDAAVARALGTSKHTLLDGVRAVTKGSAVAISAKFEDEGKGLSLSVYVASRGLDVDAESNVLQEFAGDPTAAEWKPGMETFEDVVHVARAAEQLTLMRTTRLSLADAIAKASSPPGSSVVAVTPAIRDGRAVFLARVVVAGETIPLVLDLRTGDPVGGAWPRTPTPAEAKPLVGKDLSDPVAAKGKWIGREPSPLKEAARTKVVFVGTNSYLCEGTDEAYAWPRVLAWHEEWASKGLDVRFVVGEAERAEDVEAYVRAHALPYPVLHDPKGDAARAWGLGRIAYGLVLDADGKVVWQGRIGPQGDPAGCEAAIRGEIEKRSGTGSLAPR
jgi:hypothetical protein